ncbi:MAG TPA: 3'-5' exonuclease [Methanospirillum sp.]|nr:3'-5' exonuclease [Methanospirillum sp.]
MRYLIFDTETTGLPLEEKDPFHYPDYWPRIVQIAWILCDENACISEEHCLIVKPEGFTIPQKASQIHGITTEVAIKEGIPIGEMLEIFSKAIEVTDIIVGHDIDFDRKVVTSEYARKKQNAPIYGKEHHCTMKASTDLCKLPTLSNRRGYRQPTLAELQRYLFEEECAESHDTLTGVKACSRCYFELLKRDCFSDEAMKLAAKKERRKRY